MRRTIGPAYEVSPAEKTGRWLCDNSMRLLSAAVVTILYCLLVNWIVDGFMNFLASGGTDDAPARFSSNTPTVDLVKLVGSIMLVWFICSSRTD